MTDKRPGVYGFFEEFRFLSNFWDARVEFEGVMYPSTEAAYQAAKCEDRAERKKFLKLTPYRSKKLGQEVKMRRDWEKVKYDVMLAVVRDKFTRHDDLREMLLATEDLYLEETNHWGDRVWGVCDGTGTNWLGKILMKVRDEVRDDDVD